MEYNGYLLVNDKTFGYWGIKALGKGAIPLGLRGIFTTKTFAMRAIDNENIKKE